MIAVTVRPFGSSQTMVHADLAWYCQACNELRITVRLPELDGRAANGFVAEVKPPPCACAPKRKGRR